MADIEIRVVSASKDQDGARKIQKFLEDPFYNKSQLLVGPRAVALVPEGSIRAYLEKHLEDFGGSEAYVFIYITPIYADGVVGASRQLTSPQEMAENWELGLVKFRFEITPEQIALLKCGEIPPDFLPDIFNKP